MVVKIDGLAADRWWHRPYAPIQPEGPTAVVRQEVHWLYRREEKEELLLHFLVMGLAIRGSCMKR